MFQYLSRMLGLDSVTFGYLQTTFGVLQLLGGPVFGRYNGHGPQRSPSGSGQLPQPHLGPMRVMAPRGPEEHQCLSGWVEPQLPGGPTQKFHSFWFVVREKIYLVKLSWL